MTGVRYVSAWDQGRRDMGAHWIKEGVTGSKAAMLNNTLDSLMQMDHVIRVDDDGLVWDDVSGMYAPEVIAFVDDDGQYTDSTERDMAESIRKQGWEPQGGWSGQQGTTSEDYTMHDAEFVGGNLAEHIIGTPGLWVVCEVRTDEDGDDNCAGWIVMRQIDCPF